MHISGATIVKEAFFILLREEIFKDAIHIANSLSINHWQLLNKTYTSNEMDREAVNAYFNHQADFVVIIIIYCLP